MTTKMSMLALCCCAVMPVAAQQTGIGDYLKRMDVDGNGCISQGEYQDWLTFAFDAMDRDRDGILQPAEQPGGRGKVITREEHRARIAERFRKQDSNKDGCLSTKELAAPPR